MSRFHQAALRSARAYGGLAVRYGSAGAGGFFRPTRGLPLLASCSSSRAFPSRCGYAEQSPEGSSTEALLRRSRDLALEGDLAQAAQLATRILQHLVPSATQGAELSPLDPHVCSSLIEIFSRTKRIDKVSQLLQLMKRQGLEPDLATYTSVVLASNRPHTIAQADAIYDKIVDERLTPDASFYDAYISALVGAGKFRRAHQIYFHMTKRQKLPATRTTFKNLITIYGESRRWDLVQKVLRMMAKRNIPLESTHHGAVIISAAKALGVDEAFAWVERLETGRDETTYNALIEACCLRTETLDKSWRALRNMKKAGITPSIRTYNTLLEGYVRSGRAHEIDPVLEEIAKNGLKKDPYTYRCLVQAYCASAELTKAFGLFQEYKATGLAPRRDIYDSLLRGLTQHLLRRSADLPNEDAVKTVSQADALVEEMRQADVPVSVFTYTNLIEMHLAMRNTGKSLELYEEMKRGGLKPDRRLVELMGAVVAHEIHRSDSLSGELPLLGM